MALEEIEKKLYKQTASEKEAPAKTPPQEKITESDDNLTKGWERARMTSFREKTASRQKTLGKISGLFGGLKNACLKISEYEKYGRWIFWGTVSAIIVLLAISGFYIYQYFTSESAALSVEAPKEAMIGAPFDLKVQLDNQSENDLQKVQLSIVLPEDMASLVEGQSKEGLLTQDLGNLAKGDAIQRKIPLVILSDGQTTKRFKVSFSYLPSDFGGRLEKIKEMEVAVKESAIKLDLTAPEKVLNNEEFEIVADYSNISDVDFYDAKIKFVFPDNFIFKDSEPKMSGKWFLQLDSLPKGANGQMLIKGKLVGEENKFFEIKDEAELSLLGRTYKINEKTASVFIASSPLSMKISVNGASSNYVSQLKDKLRYTLAFRNNTDVGLQDAVIKAKITGEMFDFSTLETKGFFSSADNTVTWNAANTPELRLLAPGAGGELSFDAQTKENFPIRKKSDKNFTLKVQGEISSPTVPYYVSADKSIGLASLENKVAGATQIEALAYFKEPGDSNSGIINKGSLPPRVNIPTGFTIHWLIKNYATDVDNVGVKASLQSGVRWTGIVQSNAGTSTPVYNERTQEVSWFINKIAATKGVISEPVEAIFQIEATPNVTQINGEVPLISDAQLTAIDGFTGLKLTSGAKALKTGALSDPNLESKDTRVAQ